MGALHVHEEIRDWPALRREMENFRPEMTRGGRETWNAGPGAHDDLLISAALAAWYLQGAGRPGEGFAEFYRRKAGDTTDRSVVAVDIGQASDPTAICIMTRVTTSDPETVAPGFRPAGSPITDEQRRLAMAAVDEVIPR
jgi:hypothetical protein